MEQIRLDDSRMRYIVPFSYEKEKYSLESIKTLMLDKDSNVNYCWAMEQIEKGEQDLYDYFLNSFDGENQKSLGCSFTLERKSGDTDIFVEKRQGNGAKYVLLNLFYIDKQNKKQYQFDIVDAGVYIFHTGVGLFWYEVKFRNDEMSAAELVFFQNEFKELNRHIKESRIKIVGKCNLSLETNEEIVDGIEYVIMPNKVKEKYKGYPVQNVTMGKWIYDLLKDIGVSHFYKERKCVLNHELMVPDKTLLFNYFPVSTEQVNDNDADLIEFAYYMTNGYKPSYKMIPKEEDNMYKPFENMYWYISYEGLGGYVRYDESNKDFFVGTLYNKVMNDYFLIYIQLLQQKYSAIRLSEKIEQNLPADIEEYNNKKKYKDTAENIQKLLLEVNVFLTKNVWASISHIHHQNLLYEYAHKQLRIENDVNSLTEGLEALENIQSAREGKDRSRLMDYFTMFAIVSVFADGITFLYTFLVDKIIGRDNIPTMIIEIINATLVTALVLICCILPVKMIKPMFGERKKHGKKSIDLILLTLAIAVIMVICITTAWFFTIK